jgi:hypothetical protein
MDGIITSMTAITTEEALDYLRRWELVREREATALRDCSLDTKVRQLSVLMASRDLFNADRDREQRVQVVRDRWARIRAAFDE